MSGLKSKIVVFSIAVAFVGSDAHAAVSPAGPAPNAYAAPWTSTDTVTAEGATTFAESRLGGPVSVQAEAVSRTADMTPAFGPGERYSRLDVSYFQEIALGAEYGSTSRVIRKWGGDILVQVHGSPSAEDMVSLQGVLTDLRRVMGQRRVEIVSKGANVDVHFAPEGEFRSIDPNYQATNYGFFWVWWGPDHQLVKSRVLISTTDISQEARSHLIREEITQSLGLMNDSWRYPESIYYQGWTRTRDYAPIDLRVIEMLYREEIRPGMSEAEALEILRDLPRVALPVRVAAAG